MTKAALFIITKNWKQCGCPSAGEWINNLSGQWYVTQQGKERLDQAMKRHGGNGNAQGCVEEASLKRPRTVRFQPHNLLEEAQLWRQLKNQWLPGLRREGGMNR